MKWVKQNGKVDFKLFLVYSYTFPYAGDARDNSHSDI
nr:hypothetical protein DDGNMFGP_00004 [Gallid alphaherpesvirus 2]